MKLRVHQELRQTLFGQGSVFTRAAAPPLVIFDSRKLLALWQLNDEDPTEKSIIMDKLRREVGRAYNVRHLQRGPRQSTLAASSVSLSTTTSAAAAAGLATPGVGAGTPAAAGMGGEAGGKKGQSQRYASGFRCCCIFRRVRLFMSSVHCLSACVCVLLMYLLASYIVWFRFSHSCYRLQ